MTVLDAAREILKESGKPLHYSEIARQIRHRGLARFQSSSFDRAVYSRLSENIRIEGAHSDIRRVAKGTYVLAEHTTG